MNVPQMLYALAGGITMAYCIHYGPVKTKDGKKERRPGRLPLLLFSLTVLLVILISVSGIGPIIRNFLLPGDAEVTQAALQTMVQNLGDGRPLWDTVTAFCQEILENAKNVS